LATSFLYLAQYIQHTGRGPTGLATQRVSNLSYYVLPVRFNQTRSLVWLFGGINLESR
jgi:hypothetical protein